MSDLIAGNEELHKLEVSVNAIEKLCNFLSKGTIQANRLEGILLALGELCSSWNRAGNSLCHWRCVTQLVQLAKSMDSSIRLKSVCALRNLLFLADEATARSILSELTVSTLANLISDPELLIQEQALAFTANFIDGHLDSIEYFLSDDSNIIVAIVRKLHSASSPELCFQGMCVLNNIAAGDESHIEAVMSYVIPYKLMNVPPLS